MGEPFPELTYLSISSEDGNAPICPLKFLGGHVPCLLYFDLKGIPLPALPTLLLSASDLRMLYLNKIPTTCYISPKEMAACLATLPWLNDLQIEFQSATPHPNRMDPPPVTRAVLCDLRHLEFMGSSEYLEDLVARIDCPWTDKIYIKYYNQFIDFQVAQLPKFITRSQCFKPIIATHAHLTFFSNKVSFHMYPPSRRGHPPSAGDVYISVGCEGLDWQVSHMAQVPHLPFSVTTNFYATKFCDLGISRASLHSLPLKKT